MNSFPWWFQKLLLHYLPHYVVRLLEDPWIVGVIIGTFFIIKLFTVGYVTCRLIQERKKRKKIEADHVILVEHHEKLKMVHEQQQAALLTLLSKSVSTNQENVFSKNASNDLLT